MRNIDLTFALSNFSNITAQKKQTRKEKFCTYRRAYVFLVIDMQI